MATDKNKAQNSADALLEQLLRDGATELRLDRAMYSAEKSNNAAVVGFVIDLLDMPVINKGTKQERDWQAFVILLTHPTKGVDREDNVVDVGAGEEIVVPATYQIQHALKRFAKDPKQMHELGIQPKKKIDIGGGQSFWTYRAVATGNTKERGAVYALPGGPTDVKALPPGSAGTTSDGSVYNKQTGELQPAVGG